MKNIILECLLSSIQTLFYFALIELFFSLFNSTLSYEQYTPLHY
ncbi:hypothetical protein Pf1_00326 [Flavobacterium columnare]|nr:hypothetical protein Pf1_00326 [Flavobacterium columnare]